MNLFPLASGFMRLLTFEGPFSYGQAPIITVGIRPAFSQIPARPVRGMLDTGANVCVVSPAILHKLDLTFLSAGPFHTASKTQMAAAYGAAIILSGDAGRADVEPVKTVSGEPVDNDYDLIIGRVVIQLGKLSVSGGRFTFQLPTGPHHPAHGSV